MIRPVLTVLLGIALLAASLPAVEAARYERSESHLETAAERLDRTAASLVETEDPTAPGLPDATRYLVLRLPTATLTTAGIERIALDGRDVPGGGGTVTATFRGGRPVVLRLTADFRTPAGPATLDSGRSRLRLVLRSDGTVGIRTV